MHLQDTPHTSPSIQDRKRTLVEATLTIHICLPPQQALTPKISFNRLRSFVLLSLILIVALHAYTAWIRLQTQVVLVTIEAATFCALVVCSWLFRLRIWRHASRDQLSAVGGVHLPITYPLQHDLATWRSKDTKGNDGFRILLPSLQHRSLPSWIMGLIQSGESAGHLERATTTIVLQSISQLWSNTRDTPFLSHTQTGDIPYSNIYIACLNLARSPTYPVVMLYPPNGGIVEGSQRSDLEQEAMKLLNARCHGTFITSQVFVYSTLMPTPCDEPATSFVATRTTARSQGPIPHGVTHCCRHLHSLGRTRNRLRLV